MKVKRGISKKVVCIRKKINVYKRKTVKRNGSGGIRTQASEETGA